MNHNHETISDEDRNIIYISDSNKLILREEFNLSPSDSGTITEHAMVSSNVAEINESLDDVNKQTIIPEIILLVEGISRNFREYTAESMKNRKKNLQGLPGGVASLTIPIPKPVIIAHSAERKVDDFGGAVVGRITTAKFFPAGAIKGGVMGEEKAHIKIWPEIVDPLAIEMIQDGRIKSVSISVEPTVLTCSICDTDLVKQYTEVNTVKDGEEAPQPCYHRSGMKYDGKLCTYKVGPWHADEISFVTIPGVTLSYIKDINTQESVKNDNSESIGVNIGRGRLSIELLDGDRDINSMHIMEQLDYYTIDDIDVIEVEEGWSKDDLAMCIQLENDLIETLHSQGYYEDDSAAYEVEEKKLSTAQRKKLKPSTFCGPSKSFPIPDCAHVTAGLRLLGRYKGSGNKGRIRSCIMAKAKKLGCKTSESYEVSSIPLAELQSIHNELHGQFNKIMKSSSIDHSALTRVIERHLNIAEALVQLTDTLHKVTDKLDDTLWSSIKTN